MKQVIEFDKGTYEGVLLEYYSDDIAIIITICCRFRMTIWRCSHEKQVKKFIYTLYRGARERARE